MPIQSEPGCRGTGTLNVAGGIDEFHLFIRQYVARARKFFILVDLRMPILGIYSELIV